MCCRPACTSIPCFDRVACGRGPTGDLGCQPGSIHTVGQPPKGLAAKQANELLTRPELTGSSTYSKDLYVKLSGEAAPLRDSHARTSVCLWLRVCLRGDMVLVRVLVLCLFLRLGFLRSSLLVRSYGGSLQLLCIAIHSAITAQ